MEENLSRKSPSNLDKSLACGENYTKFKIVHREVCMSCKKIYELFRCFQHDHEMSNMMTSKILTNVKIYKMCVKFCVNIFESLSVSYLKCEALTMVQFSPVQSSQMRGVLTKLSPKLPSADQKDDRL
ncbi:hypothetical protein AVEN_132006-1 [Araneus ventricosus]|uniref:Uncharacterized protein n=1 Tax=Araneus ventricosus TaxID=182803 RepID=A0A4Y2B2K2_ARAVE|nr:hypothetical protein AVEN_132006-1 [Araneus ventricosus]